MMCTKQYNGLKLTNALTIRLPGCSDIVMGTLSLETCQNLDKNKRTAFRKLALLPSSGRNEGYLI
jgi:hypothetical protein